mgnify:CR=1 FL=1
MSSPTEPPPALGPTTNSIRRRTAGTLAGIGEESDVLGDGAGGERSELQLEHGPAAFAVGTTSPSNASADAVFQGASLAPITPAHAHHQTSRAENTVSPWQEPAGASHSEKEMGAGAKATAVNTPPRTNQVLPPSSLMKSLEASTDGAPEAAARRGRHGKSSRQPLRMSQMSVCYARSRQRNSATQALTASATPNHPGASASSISHGTLEDTVWQGRPHLSSSFVASSTVASAVRHASALQGSTVLPPRAGSPPTGTSRTGTCMQQGTHGARAAATGVPAAVDCDWHVRCVTS